MIAVLTGHLSGIKHVEVHHALSVFQGLTPHTTDEILPTTRIAVEHPGTMHFDLLFLYFAQFITTYSPSPSTV